MRCTRYRDYLASLQPPQDQVMIRAANFSVESILQIIQEKPEAAFVRVYYGIEADGRHLLFMTPVSDAGTATAPSAYDTLAATSSATEEDLVFADECCHCPPRLNCPKDVLIEG